MKRSKMALAWLLILLAVTFLAPAAAQAETSSFVTVVVKNDTYASGPWTGTLFEVQVPVESGMTVEQAIREAFEAPEADGESIGWINFGTVDSPAWFINTVSGLTQIKPEEVPEGEIYNMSGWMVSINNWFSLTTLSTEVADWDYIMVEFTTNGGPDLNADWGSNDKSLRDVETIGTLDSAFSPEVLEYTLTVPAGTEQLVLHHQAANRNFLVVSKVGSTEYKWNQPVPVEDGTQIVVYTDANGDNGGIQYTFTVAYEDESTENGEVTSEEDNSPATGDSRADNLLLGGAIALSLAGIAFALIARRRPQE